MTGIFSDIKQALADLITALPRINDNNRKQIREVVLQLESELERSMVLAILYLDGVSRIKPKDELIAYLQQAPAKLMDGFNQFKICAGLYGLADRFDQVFSTVRGSIDVSNLRTVENLVRRLADGESIIVYELRDMTDMLSVSARELDVAQGGEFENRKQQVYERVGRERDKLEKRKRWLRRTVKDILDKM